MVLLWKDIKFSNSPAEAIHKTFKSYYADEAKIEDTNHLTDTIAFFVNDFNTVRPKHSLKGFTPDEVYYNNKPEIDFKELLKQDAIRRKTIHKSTACSACPSKD